MQAIEHLEREDFANGQRLGTFADTVFQRGAERIEADLESITRLGFNPVGERQRGGTEVMHVNITRAQELRVLEVVEFEIGQTVAHVVFAAEKLFFPDRFAIARDAAGACQVAG